jgi:hypothetical protein
MRTDCADTTIQAVLDALRPTGLFSCFFPSTRLTYSATFIPTPMPAPQFDDVDG